jgi:hypothetical protein
MKTAVQVLRNTVRARKDVRICANNRQSCMKQFKYPCTLTTGRFTSPSHAWPVVAGPHKMMGLFLFWRSSGNHQTAPENRSRRAREMSVRSQQHLRQARATHDWNWCRQIQGLSMKQESFSPARPHPTPEDFCFGLMAPPPEFSSLRNIHRKDCVTFLRTSSQHLDRSLFVEAFGSGLSLRC